MDHHHKVVVPLAHRIRLSTAIRYLLHHLDCNSWYVAAHREHQFVLHLTKGDIRRYALLLQCTEPVDKGVYHDSIVSSVSIIPLGSETDVPQSKIDEIMQLARGEDFAESA